MGFLASRGIVELEDVKIADLREYIHFLSHSEDNTVLYPNARRCIKKNPGASTVASHVRVIRAFFSWCVDEELSRELGHSDVQVTGRVYLGDFKSTEAREDHGSFSPVGDINIMKSKRGTKKQNKKMINPWRFLY